MRGDTYRAKVTRASGAGVWFTIRSRWPGVEFGPCPTLVDTLYPGDRVLVSDTNREDFVVLGVIFQGVV